MRKMAVLLRWTFLLLTMGNLVLSTASAGQFTYAYILAASDGTVSAIGADRRSSQATVLTAAASISADGLTRRNNERSVTVDVTPLDLSPGPGTLEFRIVLDTHSGNLDYDLVRITSLVDNQGNEYRAASWDGATGGHHVEGLLKFAGRDRILSSGVNFLEMRITDVAGVPSRTFRWDLRR